MDTASRRGTELSTRKSYLYVINRNIYEDVTKSFRTESITKYTVTKIHSLRCNTKSYGGRTHYTDSQNSDTTASSGRELYHSQFSLQVPSPEIFGYTLVHKLKATLKSIQSLQFNVHYKANSSISASHFDPQTVLSPA
jgi:hypothetical protein